MKEETAAEASKIAGFKSLTEQAMHSSKSTTTLRYYYKENKRMWDASIAVGMRRKEKEECYRK